MADDEDEIDGEEDDAPAPKKRRDSREKITRDTELSSLKYIREAAIDAYDDIEQGYVDQRDRADEILNYWQAYNCELSDRQFYSGNSKIFVPIINSAVEARKTRFTNQIFPQSGRNVECITNDIDLPQAMESLLESYVRRAQLRTQVIPAMMVAGDVEGQYSLYTGWRKHKRNVIERVDEPIAVPLDGAEVDLPGETVPTVREKVVYDECPYAEVIPDTDLLVLPQTADSIDEALAMGGSVTVLRRWTKSMIQSMVDDGDFDAEAAKSLMGKMRSNADDQRDTKKKLAEAAGVVRQDGVLYVLGYETWKMMKVRGQKRLCRIYYGGPTTVLGVKLCPYWCDKPPIISAPVNKTAGVFKGISMLKYVLDMQVLANDAVNEGADTAHFSAMPIIMTDPDKNPNYGTMILGLAAVWAVDPNSTKFAEFPKLWQDMFAIVASAKSEIFQSLNVNPAMIPQSTGTDAKRNQAEIANEQQVDILTTADAVTNVEGSILTQLVDRWSEYDYQFRNRTTTVKVYGEFGIRANMQEIPPAQAGKRYEYRWLGVEAARNAAMMQQQISGMNVLRGIPPALYPNYQMNLVPVIVQMVEGLFGPRLAPQIFVSIRDQISIDPQLENELMSEALECVVHPGDDDMMHMQEHMLFLHSLVPGSPAATQVQAHLIRHQGAMQMKAKALMEQRAQLPGVPGTPGGVGGGGIGLPGAGSAPALPNNMNAPNGAISQDQMGAAGAVVMPRQ